MNRHLKRYLKLLAPVTLCTLFAVLFGVIYAPSAESAVGGKDRALEVVRSFGPMKVVATDQALNANGNVVSETRVEQLLDAKRALARETVTDLASGELLSERSIVGNKITSVYHGVDYVSHYVGLEPPAFGLTLWGGYEDLLTKGDPVELSDRGQDHRLTVRTAEGEVVVFLGDDYLPTRIVTTPSKGPGEAGVTREIAYESIEKVRSFSAADVKLTSIPANPIVVEEHVVLPVSDPKIREKVPFGQYSLGTGVLGYELAHAEYLRFSPRVDYAPAGIDGLVLIYNAPGGDTRDKNNDIQLTCHPVKGDRAEKALADYETRIGSGTHRLLQRVVAGQLVDVLVKTYHVDPSRMTRAYVVLNDCVLELHASITTADLDLVLESIKPLK